MSLLIPSNNHIYNVPEDVKDFVNKEKVYTSGMFSERRYLNLVIK